MLGLGRLEVHNQYKYGKLHGCMIKTWRLGKITLYEYLFK